MRLHVQAVIELDVEGDTVTPAQLGQWIKLALKNAHAGEFPKPDFDNARITVRPAQDEPTLAQMREDAQTVQDALGPMWDTFKAQMLLALIVRAPNKQITISAKEIDRMGEWIATMQVDQMRGEFTMKAQKKS